MAMDLAQIEEIITDLDHLQYQGDDLDGIRQRFQQEKENDEPSCALVSGIGAIVDAVYSSLSHGDIVRIATHPRRPTALDYMNDMFDDFRLLGESDGISPDPAMVSGLARIGGRRIMVIGQEKGKFEAFRNGGVAKAAGYRNALHYMKLAEQKGYPIVTLIDTPGADPDEEGLIAHAISGNIYEMVRLQVPVLSVVIGEGGSGGALGIGAADRLYMLDKSYFSVISQKGACGILRRAENDKAVFDQTMEDLRVTAEDNLNNRIIDGIIEEPLMGAHTDKESVYQAVYAQISKALRDLANRFDPEHASFVRLNRFRGTAKFAEYTPDAMAGFKAEHKEAAKEPRSMLSWVGFGRKSPVEFISCPNKEERGCKDYPRSQIFRKYDGICRTCGYNFPIPVDDSLDYHLNLLLDSSRRGGLKFEEFDSNVASVNPNSWEGFGEKLEADAKKSGHLCSLLTGYARIGGHDVVLAISNYGFRRGTLGGAEAEKFCRAIFRAVEEEKTFVSVNQSGGVRIQEGTNGLMQMATTNAALAYLRSNEIPYISVLIGPTMAGVLASYATQGDMNIGVRDAQIGFAGRNVILTTTNTEVAQDYHSAQNVLRRGGLDMVVPRTELKRALTDMLDYNGI